MNLLLTGKETSLSSVINDALASEHKIDWIGRNDCDHRQPDQILPLCEGKDAILHCDAFSSSSISEADTLDWATRGTYVLLQSALQAGVGRLILASTLDIFDAYPADYVVDETWQPQPNTDAVSLAPYLAEVACREFSRQGGISCMALRFGALGQTEGTSETDVIKAMQGALAFEYEPHGYRWHVFHVYSGERYVSRSAQNALRMQGEGT